MFSRVAASTRLALVVIGLVAASSAREPSGEYFFGVEIGGVLCGYARVTTAPLAEGSGNLTLLTHEIVVRGTLLGSPVDNRMVLTYHLDPAAARFIYHESLIEQGPSRMTSVVRIEAGKARVSESGSGKEEVVDLPAGVVLANTLWYPHLLADFASGKAEARSYLLFDGRGGAIRETVYTRKSAETLRLAGQSFDTVVLDVLDRRTGVASTMWLDTRTGMVVQTRTPGGRRTYLADPSVVDAVNRAGAQPDLNPSVMTKTNVTIRKVRDISSMKVRVVAQPSGLWLTPASLNVPGQRFTGTVRDNAVDGVFEIAHTRYDGAKAPPFPPDVRNDPALREFLAADSMIQSDDPVLTAKAHEITAGARDSWDAVRRLSQWVSGNVKGAIPGGVTARGTYDQRAGDCGGHSFLMAAFARSVGIPARVVWGCMYTPFEGGAFGEHAWNEVYMGEAGWIPLDTTIAETDYVDSGHIRIGILQSLSNALNPRVIEIVDHRVSGAVASSPAAGASKYDPYVGEYRNIERGNPVKVLERDDALALDIPGQTVLTFKEPDARGAWRSTISDDVFVTFERGDSGAVAAMTLHQATRLPRTGPPASPLDGVPAEFRPYPGVYLFQQAQARFTVVYEGATLVINDPLAKRAFKLKPGGQPGTWIDEFGKFTVHFDTDAGGAIAAMRLEGTTLFRR